MREITKIQNPMVHFPLISEQSKKEAETDPVEGPQRELAGRIPEKSSREEEHGNRSWLLFKTATSRVNSKKHSVTLISG